ncbi:TolC family protein [Flavobacterium segetis]|uniref:TolC family protein n=1 Tax=Flavobacterium segetis TaxID=271157 RepID=UPI0013565E6D|nr:TolC family protein [Flavobacterium segetis]
MNFFIEKALLNTALWNDLNNQSSSLTIDSLLYKANLKPQLSANLTGNYAPVINNFGYDTAITNGQNVNGIVSYSQKIFGKSQKNIQLGAITLLKEKVDFNKKITSNDIKKAIRLQYIVAFSDYNQYLNLQQQFGLLNSELEILKKFTQKSIYKQTDYLLFLASVKQQEIVMLQMKNQFENDLQILNYLSGTNEKSNIVLIHPQIELKQAINAETSVFNQQFKIDSLSIENQKQNISNTYKPSLTILADAGYISTLTGQYYKHFGSAVGLNLSVPIYDGNQRKLQITKNELASETNAAYKRQFERQFKQQQEQLMLKLTQNEMMNEQLQSQLKINKTLLDAFNKLLVTGNAMIPDFVIALGNSLNITNAIAQNNMTRLLLINELNYWNTNEK